jgi:hypothetical protein
MVAAWLPAVAAGDEPARLRAEELPGLAWALAGGACAAGSDLELRQCRGVQAARAEAARGRTFVVAGDAGAVEAGADGTVTLRGCIACAAPASGLYIVTRGGLTVDGERVVGPVLGRVPGCAAGAAARLELPVRLDGVERWTQAGKVGLLVPLAGSAALGCVPGAAPAAAAAPEAPPAQPGPAEVKAALSAVEPEVARCFDRYGVPGTADVFLEVAADGAVTFAEVRGAFFDTPTGACVTAAVKKTQLPRFQRGPMRLHYPFLLR